MDKSGFEDFNLGEEILKAVRGLGYEKPSEVQNKVIPLVMEGIDVVVKSETGSGKTAAFAIPVCERIDIEERYPQALILAPTRELAAQVKQDITSIGRFKRIRCTAVFGKQPMNTQIRELNQRVHAVVGTPGRVLDHIERGNIILEKVRFLILDEADKMLSMGFIDQVEAVIKAVPKHRVTMLFSATLPEAIEALCHKYMVDPERIEVNPERLTVEGIEQFCYEVEEDKKFDLLNRILYIEKPGRCILFCRTKENTSKLAVRMKGRGYPCRELHGGMLQDDRLEAMESFKEGVFMFLAATDVAARGIDVEDITHVINYDIPMEREAYVHRIGRTGRAGEKGRAITFVTPHEHKFLREIEGYIGMELPKKDIPSLQEAEEHKEAFLKKIKSKPRLVKKKASKLDKAITKLYIGAGKKKKIRPGDIVGAIAAIDGVNADDIGIIDIQDNVSYVDILGGKGMMVLDALQDVKIKGKPVRVEMANK